MNRVVHDARLRSCLIEFWSHELHEQKKNSSFWWVDKKTVEAGTGKAYN